MMTDLLSPPVAPGAEVRTGVTLPAGTTMPVAAAQAAGFSQTGVSGALPGTATISAALSVIFPRMFIKVN